jgi:hypothetical protein
LTTIGQNGADYQNSLPEQDKTLKDFRKGLDLHNEMNNYD